MTPSDDNRMRTINLANLQCRAQWTKSYSAGRTCIWPGCTTVLSIYNPEDTCGPHRPEPDWLRYHGMSFDACPACGTVMARAGRSKRERVCPHCTSEGEPCT
jgi:hypothetical protein